MEGPMEISVHDNWLVSYCVMAQKQEIIFHTVDPHRTPPELTDVIFSGVACYYFECDNFQNIIFGIDEVNAETIYIEYQTMFEDGRKYGWPGTWSGTDETVLDYLIENQIKGFKLSASLGMVGWVLAKSIRFVSVTT